MPPPTTTTAASVRTLWLSARPSPAPRRPAPRSVILGQDVLEDAAVDPPSVDAREPAEGRHEVDRPATPDLGARPHAGPGHEHRDALLVLRAVRAEPGLAPVGGTLRPDPQGDVPRRP